MTGTNRAATVAAGVVLIVFALGVGFVALLAMGSSSGDGIWDWEPNYAAGEPLGAISVALVCVGLWAIVRAAGNPRHLRSTLLAIGVFLFGVLFAGQLWVGWAVAAIAVAIAVVIYARMPSGRDPENALVPVEAPWLAAITAGCLSTVGWFIVAGLPVGTGAIPVVVAAVAFFTALAAAAAISKQPRAVREVLVALTVVSLGALAGNLIGSRLIELAAVGIAIALATRCDSRGLLASRVVGVVALSGVAVATMGSLHVLAPLLVALAVPASDYAVARAGQYRTATR